MKLLLIKSSKTNYSLLSPDTYGMRTWGSDSQESLEKKRKHWYKSIWKSSSIYEDDSLEEYKLDVVLETTDMNKIVKYLSKIKSNCLHDILDSYKKIVDDYVSFIKWMVDYGG